MLAIFWESHDPTARAWSCQYKAVVFFHGEEQEKLAKKTKDELSKKFGTKIETEIVAAPTFYPAEDYHQKYVLRNNRDLLRELTAIYPVAKDLMNSTAAARLNGYLGGNGSTEKLEKELPGLGLSPAGGKALLERVRAFRH